MNRSPNCDRLKTARTSRRRSISLSNQSSEVRLKDVEKRRHKQIQKVKYNKKLKKIIQNHPLFIIAQSDHPAPVQNPKKERIEDLSEFNAADEEFERVDTILTISSQYNDKKQVNNTAQEKVLRLKNQTPGP